MFDYWFTSRDDRGLVYSCDMLRYRLEFRNDLFKDGKLRDVLCQWGRTDIKDYPLNTSEFKFRNLFTVDYGASAMSVGVGFNGVSSSEYKVGFLEVNPNKCFRRLQCLYDINTIFNLCWKTELLRFDLAIDIPVERDRLTLAKDGRKYSLNMSSSVNKTEYLGVRNSGGYTKLYNKGLEQKNESVILSRLEMTCEADWSVDQIVTKLPYVNTTECGAGTDEELKDLTSTQRALVRALRTSTDRDEIYKTLSANIRVKLRPYLYGKDATLVYDRLCIRDVIARIGELEEDMKRSAYIGISREALEADKQRGRFVDADVSETPFGEA